MSVKTTVRVARWAVVASHLATVGVLLAMAVPSISTIQAQLGSDYVPTNYWTIIALVALPIGMAALVVVALGPWLLGRHRWLVAIDFVTTLATFTFFWIFLFGNDWPIVLMGIAPTALALAFLVPRATARLATIGS